MNWWDWMLRKGTELQARLTGKPAKSGRGALVEGRSLEEWEKGWRRIGLLPSAHITAPKETAGLFRLLQGGNIVYLGRSQGASVECLRHTLQGLIRGGTAAGSLLEQQLRERGHELVVEVLITGCSEVAKRLEQQWLQQLSPHWNRVETVPAPARTAPPAVATVRELNPG